MKKILLVPSVFMLLIFLVIGGSSCTNSVKQVNSTIKDSPEKDFKVINSKELSVLDFETAYKLGKAFVNDYFSQRSGRSKIDFSKYIVNKNLLKYSNKRVSVEKNKMDIKEISIGLVKAQFIHEEECFDFIYGIIAKNSHDGGFSDPLEVLISNANGNLIISDWYIRWGMGVSSFDERYRPNAIIKSPKIWDNQEFVKSIFKKTGIE